MEQMINLPPVIEMKFAPKLLSNPIFVFDANYLLKLAEWIEKKLLRPEFRKHINTKNKIYLKYLEFMELYERAKVKERENKGKTCLKTQGLFYRPRLNKFDDQHLFERLERKIRSSKQYRRHN
jgi:hypothetical protein